MGNRVEYVAFAVVDVVVTPVVTVLPLLVPVLLVEEMPVVVVVVVVELKEVLLPLLVLQVDSPTPTQYAYPAQKFVVQSAETSGFQAKN